MRIHFYGVQGSGSVFPSRAEREQSREQADLHLLQQIFQRMQDASDIDGKLQGSVEDIIGGPLEPDVLMLYRSSFELHEPKVYGGWTTCIRIETSDGYELVLDCGSGFRICAEDIQRKWGSADRRDLYVFGSHAHFDHTEGFDQAAVCFDPRNHIHVIANYQYLAALDHNLGIFSHKMDMNLQGIQTPLNYELMPANFDSTEIRDMRASTLPDGNDPMVGKYHHLGDPIVLGKTQVQPFEVFHPDPCLGFRIQHEDKVFVYCTDHELRHGDQPDHPLQIASQAAEDRLIGYAQDADVMYRDGQFMRVEYDGKQGIGVPIGVSRKDWGHSCIEDVVDMAKACRVKQTYIGHHDPMRTWAERNWIDETLAERSARSDFDFELARAETIIEL